MNQDRGIATGNRYHRYQSKSNQYRIVFFNSWYRSSLLCSLALYILLDTYMTYGVGFCWPLMSSRLFLSSLFLYWQSIPRFVFGRLVLYLYVSVQELQGMRNKLEGRDHSMTAVFILPCELADQWISEEALIT